MNDDYFLAEFLVVEPPSAVYREYLQFKHYRRPMTNLAEVTARIASSVEQNIVLGWEGQHYKSRSNTIPGGGVAEAEYIELYNPVETQKEIAQPLARVRHFTHNTNAFLRREADSFTGRVGLVYQPVSAVDLYGSFANSFRPLTQAQPDGTTLEPDLGKQVEFGQRFHMLGDRVQLNTAIFHIVRENVAFGRPGGFFDQASEVKSRGFEADVMTTPVSNWRINGGYGFTDAEFGDYLVNATTNLKGNTSIMAPRHTFNVWTAYDWPNGFGVNVGVRAQSRWFIDRNNEFAIEGYGLLYVGVRYQRGAIEYAVNINNLTDTEYFASVLYDSQLYPGEPINVLGTIRVRLR